MGIHKKLVIILITFKKILTIKYSKILTIFTTHSSL